MRRQPKKPVARRAPRGYTAVMQHPFPHNPPLHAGPATANPAGTDLFRGIVDRVTYHNEDTGYSVLRVTPRENPGRQETVIVHQMRVFAGATMEFSGYWSNHPRHGRQFRAVSAVETQPASIAALEKYLGSGLIRGIGPKTAKKIVRHFGENTLDVFENSIEKLTEVPGIADKKLRTITDAWAEHRAVRNVMMFLQSHGISTLFAVRIYKLYGDDAIETVRGNPYRLADDFFGIGFLSADKVAMSMGLAADSDERIMAGIRHVLAEGRQFGHCYLTAGQIEDRTSKLLSLDISTRIHAILTFMEKENLLKVRMLTDTGGAASACYYAKSLYYDEILVSKQIARMNRPLPVDQGRVKRWLDNYCRAGRMALSQEQEQAIGRIVSRGFSILTGGPGCGKTTATRVLVKLIEAMGKKVTLAAPTGRAAQRMTDVIGRRAATIHRLLKWKGGSFRKNEKSPLGADFLVVDECSMLDISLAASLLRAVPDTCQVLFIGDADQLPSVGPGNVLNDIIASETVVCIRLTTVFRQAGESLIIRHAHKINGGEVPRIDSPFRKPGIWREKDDCLFIDSEEATLEQVQFVSKIRRALQDHGMPENRMTPDDNADPYAFGTDEAGADKAGIQIPEKFAHVRIDDILTAGTRAEELLAVLKTVHPWSSLHYGLPAVDVVDKLYREWIPRYYGKNCEIQVLSPMTRGSLGTFSLNRMIQQRANPQAAGKRQVSMGDRIFREGDRVIHKRNNYDLGVFNGDIGVIERIDPMAMTAVVVFFPDRRRVTYQRENLPELDLAYAVTIHKSQGSEFEAVIIPLLTQHYKMLYRNLVYTGLTRAKRLAVFVGTRRALAIAVKNEDTSLRQTALSRLLREASGEGPGEARGQTQNGRLEDMSVQTGNLFDDFTH